MKICFVSFEIHPATWGGCGVLLYNSTRLLLEQGHQVVFLLDMPRYHFDAFNPGDYPEPQNCKAYQVDQLCKNITLSQGDFSDFYSWRSYRFHWALQKVVAVEQPDLVEFVDYNGPAHYALSAKVTESAYKSNRLVIRLHNSDQLMDLHQPLHPLKADRYLLYALEQSALRLAETVLFPSQTYLDEAYAVHYEAWFGKLVRSQPALVEYPEPRDVCEGASVILFYGRLYGFKGVDLFVDAAVSLLWEGSHDDVRFVLAGYDPAAAPDGSNTYQEYLCKRIPARHRSQFQFVGQLSWSELEALMPQLYYAVFPSYLESFCYSAHELHAAGVPVIVNNIPGFREHFRHSENALLFDGTVKDLAQQMKTLLQNSELRERIRSPYSLTRNPLGAFYEAPFEGSWIRTEDRANNRPSLLVCILDDGKHPVHKTIQSLGLQSIENLRPILLQPLSDRSDAESGAIWFLGRLHSAVDLQGNRLSTHRLETKDALLILRAGDVVQRSYLSTCLDVLARQPELSFVGCWKQVRGRGGARLDTFPIDAALELIPFSDLPLLSRVVMRTQPGNLLLDLFDPRLMQMGEVGYLWDLEGSSGPGVLIPDPMIERSEDDFATRNERLLSYLILRDSNKTRKARLANYLVTVRLAQDGPELPPAETTLAQELAVMVKAIEASKLGRIIARYPGVLTALKTVLRSLRHSRGP